MQFNILYKTCSKSIRFIHICTTSVTFDPVEYLLCSSGGAVQQNGHTTAEIQEEVALTNMGTIATTEKRHSHVNNDKLHFPRTNLQTITTLGRVVYASLFSVKKVYCASALTFCCVSRECLLRKRGVWGGAAIQS